MSIPVIALLDLYNIRNQRRQIVTHLTQPDYLLWGDLGREQFISLFETVWKKFSSDRQLQDLLALSFFSGFVCSKNSAPAWIEPLLMGKVPFKRLFPGIGGQQLINTPWQAVPVALVSGNHTKIQYFFCGFVHGDKPGDPWPLWAQRLMDEVCKEAVYNAVQAANTIDTMPAGKFPFCYPLTEPNEICQIRDKSLGLPLALGFLNAVKNENNYGHFLATGKILNDGSLEKIEGLERKLVLAKEKEIRLMLYPQGNRKPKENLFVEAIPVSNLAEAEMSIRRYRPGNSKTIILYTEMLKDPSLFVSHLDQVDIEWIKYDADREQLNGVMGKTAENNQDFAQLVRQIQRALDSWDLERAAVYGSLLSNMTLSKASESFPLSAFRLCTLNIALANHMGDVDAAQVWAEKASTMFDRVMKADLDICADYLNNRFVIRHNRYVFEPVFPAKHKSVVTCLEKRYRVQCECGCHADKSLGELYGTITQNFAFCGPDYLEKTIQYAELAIKAFGNGTVPEYRQDLIRQYNYLIYAHLDAGKIHHAQEALMRFFEAEGWSHLLDMLKDGTPSIWHHTVLARFLSETKDVDKIKACLKHDCFKNKLMDALGHPVQLWSFNMGRLYLTLNDPENAVDYFDKSLSLCSDRTDQPTIHAMALLPLSGIWKADHTDLRGFDEKYAAAIKTAIKLNPVHFSMLKHQDSRNELLRNIWETPEKLFPFTYR